MTKDTAFTGTSTSYAAHLAHEYELIRRAGPYETLTHAFHELGIQTNILVAAKYRHQNSMALTPAILFKALASVINKHPALSTIGVSQPSEKREGNHRLWEARLPTIEMKDCVRFIVNVQDDDIALSRIFEAAHNQKFDTEDRIKPWWRLILVNSCYVVFVYHHSIGDGLSGYAFHRSLLSCLNRSKDSIDSTSTDDRENCSTIRPRGLPPNALQSKILPLFGYCLLEDFPHCLKPFENMQLTITKNRSLRIDPGIMQKLLDSCHVNNTSFTALLHTLLQATLATDFYPRAIFGFSRLAVSIRPLLRNDPRPTRFMNAAADYSRVQCLRDYRKAGKIILPESDNAERQGALHKDRVWKLAREYKSSLTNYICRSRNILQDFLIGKLLGEDEEEVGNFYGLGLYQNNSFLLSNIGVFDPGPGTGSDQWSVSEVAFSSGAIRAAVGDAGIVFDVAAVKNGSCIICATYGEGVLRDEMVQGVLDALLTRLELMV